MLIDFHTHCFPEKIAKKALEKLSYASGGLKPHTDGTLSGLRQRMLSEDVSISVVLNIATNASQQESVNNFAKEVNAQDDFVAFGSVYPYADNALDMLDQIKEMGLLGVKLHPEYQGFFADDEKMKPIYQKISRLGLITVFHAGYDFAYKPPFRGMPDNLLRAVKWFDSPVIAAHWGGAGCGYEVLDKLCGIENLYFDTSFGYGQMPKDSAMRILDKHGTDKMLFGTDSPWHTVGMEMRLLESLELSPEEKDKIFYKNAQKLLGMK